MRGTGRAPGKDSGLSSDCRRAQDLDGDRPFLDHDPGSLELADWLEDGKVTHIAMEATGVYWKPVWHVLHGRFTLILANAAHIRNVPGRKSDVNDATWNAELLAHGLIRASLVPPQPIQGSSAGWGYCGRVRDNAKLTIWGRALQWSGYVEIASVHGAERGPPKPRSWEDGPVRRWPYPGPIGCGRPDPDRVGWGPPLVRCATHVEPAPHKPTRAAPMSGPRSPRPPGTTRVPRANSSRHNWSISSCAALKKGSPNPSATDPLTTARGKSRRFTTGRDGTTDQPPRALHHHRGRESGCCPVTGAKAVPDASASRQPRAPHGTSLLGLDDDVADVAGVADAVRRSLRRARCLRRRRSTPPSRGSLRPPAAPIHPSPNARALASLSTKTGSPVASATRTQREPTPRGDVQRRHLVSARSHGTTASHPAHEDAVLATIVAMTSCTSSARSCHRVSAASTRE